MAKKELNLKEIQKAELNIFYNFKKYCKKHDIQYFLYGGTALGAVRHGGFIPWDDDMDIILARPQYEKLLALIKENPYIDKNRRFYVYMPENEKKPKYLIAKIYDQDISVKCNNKLNDGNLWIDIMQLDGLPNNYEKYLKNISLLRKVFFLIRKAEYGENSLKKAATIIITLPLRLYGYEKVTQKILKYCKKYEYSNATFVCNNAWYTTPKKIFKKKWFETVKYIQFEKEREPVCGEIEEFLKKRYGNDYMQLPPMQERETHGVKAYEDQERASR